MILKVFSAILSLSKINTKENCLALITDEYAIIMFTIITTVNYTKRLLKVKAVKPKSGSKKQTDRN